MSSRDELLLLDKELQIRKLNMLYTEYLTSKNKLVQRIRQEITTLRNQVGKLSKDNFEQQAYLDAKVENLNSFRDTVENATLFEQLSPWWVYEFSISCIGTTLYIRHINTAEIEGEEDNEWLTIYDYDATYRLIQNNCRLLSTEEYATSRNVAPSTIRVWIRRGKLRSAVKIGNAWKIPELSPPIKRGYTEASYSWETYLDGIPEEYAFLKKPGNLIIRQNSNKQGFTAIIFNMCDTFRKELHFSNAEAEKFESMLIANPSVLYTGDTTYIRQ